MWGWSPKKPKSPLERLEDKLKGDRALAFYSSLGAHAADAVSGGVIFVTGTATMQLVQKAIYVGASTLIIPKALGLAAVCASSTAAIHFASTPRELAHEWSNSSMSIADLMEYGRSRFKARWEDLPDAPYPAYMAIGVLCFRILGGRFSSLAPSNFANLGAFHLKKASLPATEEYATSVERGIVQEFGRLFGCHTCGVKRGVRYHADHMPPKLVAERVNKSMWRRLTGRKLTFRFYPQCEGCSNEQGAVVKSGRTKLKLHLSSLRMYHSTGLWLVLLGTSGFYMNTSTDDDSVSKRSDK